MPGILLLYLPPCLKRTSTRHLPLDARRADGDLGLGSPAPGLWERTPRATEPGCEAALVGTVAAFTTCSPAFLSINLLLCFEKSVEKTTWINCLFFIPRLKQKQKQNCVWHTPSIVSAQHWSYSTKIITYTSAGKNVLRMHMNSDCLTAAGRARKWSPAIERECHCPTVPQMAIRTSSYCSGHISVQDPWIRIWNELTAPRNEINSWRAWLPLSGEWGQGVWFSDLTVPKFGMPGAGKGLFT